MPDPYAIDPDTTPGPPAAPSSGTHPLRALLWTVLVLSVATNSLASSGFLPLVVNVAAGAVTALAVTALVVLRVRRR